MTQFLKRTRYCDLLAQGTTQEGEDISAAMILNVMKLGSHGIRKKVVQFILTETT